LTPKGADEAADCSTLVSLIDTPRICSLTLEVRSIYRLPHRATASVLRPGLRRDHGQGCAHVSAKFPPSRQGARLFGSYGNEERPAGVKAPSSEGSQAAHREQRVAISPQCVPEVLGVRSDRHARFRPQRTRPAPSRVPANLRSRHQGSRSEIHAVPLSERNDHWSAGDCSHPKTRWCGREEQSETIDTRGIPSQQARAGVRYCHRTEAGTARHIPGRP